MSNKTIITEAEHKERHIKLHKHFDELLADFLTHTLKFPSETTVSELIKWSYEQTKNPTESTGV